METSLKLETDKIELAKAILSITNNEILEKVKNRLMDVLDFRSKDDNIPAYTIEELHARIDHSVAELVAGRGVSGSEMFGKIENKYPWLCE